MTTFIILLPLIIKHVDIWQGNKAVKMAFEILAVRLIDNAPESDDLRRDASEIFIPNNKLKNEEGIKLRWTLSL